MKTLSFEDIFTHFPASPKMVQGDDFFILDVVFQEGSETRLAYPCCFGGLVSAYCIEGEFRLTIGMEDYVLRKDCFAVSLPGDIVRLVKTSTTGGAKLRVMGMSERMLMLMEFDRAQAMVTYRNRLIRADMKYKVLIHRFRDIIGAVIFMNHQETTKSLGLLLKSLTIELAHVWEDLAEAPVSSDSRGNRMTEQFVAMVARHHVEHRDLEYYARRMGVTPKYLSAAIKESSGKTAVEWISSYLLLEAKFYLKHTTMTIKQIAYDLNFDGQAEFYNYFRRKTGMSPTEYRNSDDSM